MTIVSKNPHHQPAASTENADDPEEDKGQSSGKVGGFVFAGLLVLDKDVQMQNRTVFFADMLRP